MQYGLNVRPYNRDDRDSNSYGIITRNSVVKLSVSMIIGLMMSRVMLGITGGMVIAPFGLAYLISILDNKDKKYKFLNVISIFIGYLTIVKSVPHISIYLIACTTLYIVNCVNEATNISKKKEILLVALGVSLIIAGKIIGNYSMWVNIVFSMLQVMIVIPMYNVLKYGVNCLDQVKTNYFFSTEDLISVCILVCLVVTGIGTVQVFGIDLRSVVSLATVIVIAFITGAGTGSAIGIAMGLIIGINTGNPFVLISTLGLCGLIVGVFKESGKALAMIAYLISWVITAIYSGELGVALAIEAVLAGGVLLITPRGVIDIAIKEINSSKKIDIINEKNLNGIKKEFSNRLEDLKSVLINLSDTIGGISENENLLIKNKGAALVESLADRACSDCEMNRKCWDRDLNNTFCSFSDLISSSENNYLVFPEYLDKKCVRREVLVRNTQELVNTYNVNEKLKERLSEGRGIIANHINNMANTMGDIIKDFNKDVGVCIEIDRLLRKTLNKRGIKYREVFCYTDRRGRLKIEIGLNNCEGSNYCANTVLNIIKELVDIPLCFTSDGCRINPSDNTCSITIQETPKYHVASHVAALPKEGESLSGDSYSFYKSDDGSYVTMISDGMGSGPNAGTESKMAVELIESFLNSGFDENTAINSVNSVIGMKFSEDEKFTTLDLNTIDLYSGKAEFIKVGGASSFIKRGEDIEVIKAQSLPFGVLDRVEIEKINSNLKHGDIIITISDGILDIDKSNIGSNIWIQEYLKSARLNPEDLAKGILEKAKILCDNKVDDDMTVIVSKVYEVY